MERKSCWLSILDEQLQWIATRYHFQRGHWMRGGWSNWYDQNGNLTVGCQVRIKNTPSLSSSRPSFFSDTAEKKEGTAYMALPCWYRSVSIDYELMDIVGVLVLPLSPTQRLVVLNTINANGHGKKEGIAPLVVVDWKQGSHYSGSSTLAVVTYWGAGRGEDTPSFLHHCIIIIWKTHTHFLILFHPQEQSLLENVVQRINPS